MEHIYEKINGWFTFPNFYQQLVSQAKNNYHFVEVGTWKGRSAAFMAVEIINSGKSIQFDCVDTWSGSEEHIDPKSPFYEPLLETPDGLFNHFLSNIEPVKHIINVKRKPSVNASADYVDGSVNCVFIDAAHDYDNVCIDIKKWLPKVKSGGILAGHDIAYEPVRRAVQDTLGDFIDIGEDVWIHRVK